MTVLAAIDATDKYGNTMKTAERLAKSIQEKLLLLHVEETNPAPADYDAGPQTVRDCKSQRLHEIHRNLQSLADQAAGRGVECSVLFVNGDIAKEILLHADKNDASFIVIGRERHAGFLSTLVGNVDHTVTYRAHRPVVVVPQEDDGKTRDR
jgi:nucleotide-binding universal stress UspA family protein